MWAQKLLCDLAIPHAPAAQLWWDNTNPVFHAHTKHIDIDYHLQENKLHKKLLDIRFIHSEDLVADGFTKALPKRRLITFPCNINLNFTESCD